jgi:hypothetical protein
MENGAHLPEETGAISFSCEFPMTLRFRTNFAIRCKNY